MSETMTCERRMEMVGPWKIEEGPDSWGTREDSGEFRFCSFCGSLHPDDFEILIKESCDSDKPRTWIECSTKSYKWYIHTPDVKSGMLKFYTHHIPSEDWSSRANKIISIAMEKSKIKYKEIY